MARLQKEQRPGLPWAPAGPAQSLAGQATWLGGEPACRGEGLGRKEAHRARKPLRAEAKPRNEVVSEGGEQGAG